MAMLLIIWEQPYSRYVYTSKFNDVDSLFKGSDMTTKVQLLLVHRCNFGWMPFIPPLLTHMGPSRS